jgi:recombinational DNA repair protein (RecF pathway)
MNENPETAVCVHCEEPLLGCAVRRVLGGLMHEKCADEFEEEYEAWLMQMQNQEQEQGEPA